MFEAGFPGGHSTYATLLGGGCAKKSRARKTSCFSIRVKMNYVASFFLISVLRLSDAVTCNVKSGKCSLTKQNYVHSRCGSSRNMLGFRK